ncbi:hypothetical protein GCM10010259_65300 [Streptomyces daghestanicus]|uniref:SseB protein N-terminal domain-containing protein n=1 Tax=Streptomyces daghestanicus TaxID=66885 RepID=A0ABQ3PWN8_9ACTN|nr:hypothetical protein GCM10010259_65300 [Streptomyces daghestanicus]GHI29432.1 hypothetical protein Sdagh_11620 [Streptomyces daghestanicus]
MTPRDGEAVAEMVGRFVGVGAADRETITVWVPAVLLFEHMTTTVYVPGLTPDHAAVWLVLVPERATWRPWAKDAWPLVSREAVPQAPLIWAQAAVVTETVDPVVLTEIPGPAAAGPAVRARGSAAAATIGPERRSG